ncbi:MAG: hypothetical protein R3288_01240 [Woeseiaceae bacterium]|nr:hypothetical protein [Woeseiaceae bacterium]
MADRIRDAEDRRLEALLRSEPLPDDGFSDRIVRRIRRRVWIRRLALPVAAAVGGAFAMKPLAALLALTVDVVKTLPADIAAIPASWLPPLPLIVLGGMLLVATMLGIRLLEE